jgi:nitronate monooxygenase
MRTPSSSACWPARDEDVVEFVSVAGLPARAVKTPWLQNYLKVLPRLQAKTHTKARCILAWDCLAQCGLRDGLQGWGQFCIDTQLAAACVATLRRACSSAVPVRCPSASASPPCAS